MHPAQLPALVLQQLPVMLRCSTTVGCAGTIHHNHFTVEVLRGLLQGDGSERLAQCL